MYLPDPFQQTIRDVHGDAGERWLADLPRILSALADRWSLAIGDPVPNLSYNLVMSATCADGTPAILKAAPPNIELTSEIAALRHYAGQGAARLLEADDSLGALLLERIAPGEMLADLAVHDDAAATDIAAEVMARLWQTPPDHHPFLTVADWGRAFARYRTRWGSSGPVDAAVIDRADALFHHLAATQTDLVVLHGDLHHDNILSAGDGWQAIDPKGIVGEPAYEVGALLRNPGQIVDRHPDLAALTRARVDRLCARLSLDRQRVLAWSDAQLVLSAVWLIEDHGPDSGWEPGIAFAELMAAL